MKRVKQININDFVQYVKDYAGANPHITFKKMCEGLKDFEGVQQ
jgi:hypothetical protein